jgi:cytochrome c peroxidase
MFFGDEGAGIGEHATGIRRNAGDNAVNLTTDFTGGRCGSTQDMTFNQWNAVHARVVAPSTFLSVNAAAEASSTTSGTFAPTNSTVDRVGFGARDKAGAPSLHATMTAAFGAFWDGGTSEAQMQAVKTLYKNTLGIGISLP